MLKIGENPFFADEKLVQRANNVAQTFGFVSSLCSALGFVMLIITIRQQTRQIEQQGLQITMQLEELRLQREEMRASTVELARAARAQDGQMRLLALTGQLQALATVIDVWYRQKSDVRNDNCPYSEDLERVQELIRKHMETENVGT